MLRDRMGLAVGLSNDAHISALGEFTFGSAHGMKNFIIISLGVGLGSCFFTDGIDHQGNLGFAGEFGHTCVVDNGRKCGCGHVVMKVVWRLMLVLTVLYKRHMR